MFLLVMGLVIGVGVPLQTAINSQLRKAVSSSLVSSMISFTVGTLFLAVILLLTNQSLLISRDLIQHQPWWIWIGGLLGVIYLTGNIILFPYLGSVQTVIMPVTGQLIMSMLIDNFGWFGAVRHSLTIIRILGAVLVAIGVIMAVAIKTWIEEKKSRLDEPVLKNTKQLPWQLVGIFTGMLSATQTAINGHLGVVLGSAEKSALISFFIGTLALWIFVFAKEHRIVFSRKKADYPWWVWLGGILGAIFVFGNAFLAPLIGTGLTVVVVLIGMISGSLLVDQFGWLKAPKEPIVPIQFCGILVMIIGVALIKLF
jgi:transporter family-2 protein